MSPVSNLAALNPRTEAPVSKDREALLFAASVPSRSDAHSVGDHSVQFGCSDSGRLTTRERDVLAMISQGCSNKRIARILEISPETVKSHVRRIFLKLGVTTRTEAVFRAVSLELLRSPEATLWRPPHAHGLAQSSTTSPPPGRYAEQRGQIEKKDMYSSDNCVEGTARGGALETSRPATHLYSWSSGPTTDTQQVPDYMALLLAIAGHDLRQPLQAIQGAHELLGLGIRTKSELHLLRSGQRAIDKLIAQLDQLLAALRLRDPEGVKPVPLQLMHLLQQVAHENEFEALKKGIKFSVIPSRVFIQSDRLLFGAILGNLVRNAVKYTDPGGRILVGCRSASDTVRIEIYDTGIGISGDEMPRLFDLFSCAAGRSGDGHGVGLYIVRQAIAILGHRLEITSSPLGGSRFCVVAKRDRSSETA
jgi:two-component system, OmpR family, phosphate regulon sensor histidine kinase PhoR